MKKLLFLTLALAGCLGVLSTRAGSSGIVVNFSSKDVEVMIDNAVGGKKSSDANYHSHTFKVPKGRTGVAYTYPYDDQIVNYKIRDINGAAGVYPFVDVQVAGNQFIVKDGPAPIPLFSVEWTKVGNASDMVVNFSSRDAEVTIDNAVGDRSPADKDYHSYTFKVPKGPVGVPYVYPYNDAVVRYTIRSADSSYPPYTDIGTSGNHFIIKDYISDRITEQNDVEQYTLKVGSFKPTFEIEWTRAGIASGIAVNLSHTDVKVTISGAGDHVYSFIAPQLGITIQRKAGSEQRRDAKVESQPLAVRYFYPYTDAHVSYQFDAPGSKGQKFFGRAGRHFIVKGINQDGTFDIEWTM